MKIKFKARFAPLWGIAVAAIIGLTITACPDGDGDIDSREKWDAAIAKIREDNSGEYTLSIDGNIRIEGTSDLSFGTTPPEKPPLTVTLQGNGKVYLDSRGNIFNIGENQTLIIDSANLTLEGLKPEQNSAAQYNNNAVIHVFKGTLKLKNGTISGNANSGKSNPSNPDVAFGGGVTITGGTFTMSGGKITGNTVARSGGGVYMDTSGGTFTMSGGEISGNTAEQTGGGVHITAGTFTMSGGKITGNTARQGGSGVYIAATGNFTRNGGDISNNTTDQVIEAP